MSEGITSHEQTDVKPPSPSEVEISLDALSQDEVSIVAGARSDISLEMGSSLVIKRRQKNNTT